MAEQNQQPTQETKVETPNQQPTVETAEPATNEKEVVKEEVVVQEVPKPAPKVEYPTKAAKPQPVQQPKPQVKDTVSKDAGDFQATINKLRVSGTPSEVALIVAFDNYIENMKPGAPLDSNTGVSFQYKLWNAMFRAIEESPAQEFNKLWGIIVAYFREHHKGVFGGRYVNRFSEYWTRSLDELAAFQQLTNLLDVVITNPQNVNKLVSIHRVVEKGFTEVGRGRLISLYS